jgi:hypothetical protein
MNSRVNSAIWLVNIILLASILIGWHITLFLLVLSGIALVIKDPVRVIWLAVTLTLLMSLGGITLTFIIGVVITLIAKLASTILRLHEEIMTTLTDSRRLWIYYAKEFAPKARQAEILILQPRR